LLAYFYGFVGFVVAGVGESACLLGKGGKNREATKRKEFYL